MIRRALFSDEDPPRFRWSLSRAWREGRPALICMANPSTADAEDDDPTVGQCNQLFKALGFPGYTVVNWSPLIASDPKVLHAWCWNSAGEHSEIHARNVELIRSLSAVASIRLVAWGKLIRAGTKTGDVLAALSLGGRHPLYCFDKTKNGSPKHPMARGRSRIEVGQPLQIWRAAG